MLCFPRVLRPCALCVLGALPSLATTTTLDEARDLHRAGDLEAALEAYRDVVRQGGDADNVGTAHNNACVILTSLGDHLAALEACDAALEQRRRTGDEGTLARTLNNLGLVRQNLGRYTDAEESYLEALAINRRRGDAEALAINLSNLGLLATVSGHYTRALAYFRAVADTAAPHASDTWAPAQLRLAQLNQGVVMEKLGAYREALDLYRQVLAGDASLEPRHRASLEVNIGVVYRNLGDPVRALLAFDAARDTYAALGDRSGLSNAYLNRGLVKHLNLGDMAGAEQDLRQALALARESGDRTEEITDLFYLGQLLLDMGELEEARGVFEQCLLSSQDSGSVEGRWSALEGLGRVAAVRGDLGRALVFLDEAMSQIETVRAELSTSALRSGFFGERRTVFEVAVEVLARLHAREPDHGHAARALEVAQRAKARELLEALGSRSMPGAPLESAVLSRLAGEDRVLEYFVAGTQLYRWEIGGGQISMRDLGAAGEIQREVEELYRRWSRAAAVPAPLLERVSQELLGELDTELADIQLLQVAPDRFLYRVPFDLLRTTGEGAALLERTAVVYLPSASALGWLHRDPMMASLAWAGFADPLLPRRGETWDLAASIVERFELEQLGSSAAELERVRHWVSGRQAVRTGAEATEENLREVLAEGVSVLHLATHAIIDERPGRSAAVLLTASGVDDGLLLPEEIAALRVNSALTVLAACRTAAGLGDGVSALGSLTGAFLAAGSAAVLATLWDVEDAAAASFMEQFYYQLARGHPAGEALRRAKLTLRADPRWNDPSVWAPYVLAGDARSRLTARAAPWPWVTAGAFLALAALGWLWLGRRRSRLS